VTMADIFFLICVIFIWFMIFYQLALSVAGFLYYLRSRRERKEMPGYTDDSLLPLVSILIPAHNEERVIRKTIRKITAFDYPRDKMEIIAIDDSSTDSTGALLDALAADDPRIRVLHLAPPEGGQGKSRALNMALGHVRGEFLAVYDADNRPDPAALKHLVLQLMADPSLGAAAGKFRTANASKNLLTRFINIEGISFQWIVQAGRWFLFRLGTIPGTNFIIRTELIRALNGWDEKALTEDAELSIRIYKAGKKIKFVPHAVTWEQEPETVRVWLKQRTRWVRGNNYVVFKFLREWFSLGSKRLMLEILYFLSLYYIFFAAILLSDAIFIGGLFGWIDLNLPGPFNEVWILAYVLFILEIYLALSFEHEDRPKNLLTVPFMYLTYCQLWLPVVFMGILQDLGGRKRVWDKTERFEEKT